VVALLVVALAMAGAVGCRASSKQSKRPQLHVFTVDVTGDQNNLWRVHGDPCNSQYTANGEQSWGFSQLDGGTVAVYHDPAVTGPIRGDSTFRIAVTGHGSATASGASCPVGGCAPACGPAEDRCTVRHGSADVTFRYDGGQLALAKSRPDGGAEVCGMAKDAPMDPEHYRPTATFAADPLPPDDLLDLAKTTLRTKVTGTWANQGSGNSGQVSQELKLSLSVKLRRVVSVVDGRTVSAATCEDAYAVVKGWRDAGTNVAETAWTVSSELTDPAYTKVPGGVHASAKLKLKTGKHAISLPVWTNVPNDVATQSAWQEARKLLLAHEEGHVKITDDYVRQRGDLEVSGTGADDKAARDDLRRNVDRVMKEIRDQIGELQDAYDVKTEHGRTQSKVGGKDTVLVCPPR
jgi:hypothetical protein